MKYSEIMANPDLIQLLLGGVLVVHFILLIVAALHHKFRRYYMPTLDYLFWILAILFVPILGPIAWFYISRSKYNPPQASINDTNAPTEIIWFLEAQL